MATKRLIATIILVFLAAVFPVVGSRAQAPAGTGNSGDTCQQILSRAMDSVQSSCDGLDRNKACYGNNRVKVEPNGDSIIKFDAVGDRAAIQNIHTLVTSPLDIQ